MQSERLQFATEAVAEASVLAISLLVQPAYEHPKRGLSIFAKIFLQRPEKRVWPFGSSNGMTYSIVITANGSVAVSHRLAW